MARFSLKSTLISVLFLIIFILTISQIKHEKNPKLDPMGPKNLDPKEALEMFDSEYESPIGNVKLLSICFSFCTLGGAAKLFVYKQSSLPSKNS